MWWRSNFLALHHPIASEGPLFLTARLDVWRALLLMAMDELLLSLIDK